MAVSGRGVDRMLKKLKDNIDKGNFYEAHQLYKGLYFRYKSQKKYPETIELLYSGSTSLLEKEQYGSGADLALLLVDAMQTGKATVDDSNIARLGNIHKMIHVDTPERSSFVAAAVRWSQAADDATSLAFGHPQLHSCFAQNFWQEKNYSRSRYHFVYSMDGENCATMLIEYHIAQGYPSEVDLFIAQAVLQYLCLKNHCTASAAFDHYTKEHPQVEKGPPFIRPLLNFLWLLLLAVEGGKLAIFSILVEKYQASIQRDPNYREYLDKIGQLFFGVPPPHVSHRPGLLDNLLQSMWSPDEEDHPAEFGRSDPPAWVADLD